MAQQAEPGHVGRGVHSDAEHGTRCASVERGHRRDGGRHIGLTQQVALQRRGQNSRADRLRQHQGIARPRAGVAHDVIRMHFTNDRHAVFGLGVVHRVPAQEEGARRARHVRPAAQHLAQQIEREPVTRPPHEVEGEQRRRAHGVDVRERVVAAMRPKS